jgi:SAM-dependent MidA family methyltransferase
VAPPSLDERNLAESPDPASVRDLERVRAAARRLRDAAAPDGRLPFDRWVEIALYDPEVGYYSAPDRRLGRTGDFYTASHASPLFGGALANRIRSEWERLGRPPDFRILELGPGDGTLAHDVTRTLVAEAPQMRPLRYAFIERSRSLASRLRERLRAAEAEGALDVRRFLSVGEDGPFRGVVLANEVFDALPFRRFVRRVGEWRECLVRVNSDRPRWEEASGAADVEPPPLGDAEDGTVLEVSTGDSRLLRAVADHLLDGTMIVADYGAEESELTRRGPSGTLAAYRAHRPVDPLVYPGVADVSAWVNFTRLRAHARAHGLREVAYRSQAEALAAWGLASRIERSAARASSPEEEVRIRLAAKNLLFGFGTFRALELVPAGAGGNDASPAPDVR